MPDIVEITILEDGMIKVETGKISGPNHLSAEAFLREMSKLAGGEVVIRKKHGIVANQQSQQKPLEQ